TWRVRGLVTGLVYGHDAIVAEWVAKAMGDPAFERGFGNCTAIGVEEGGRLIGGVVYHDWSPEAGVVEMSAAATSKRWLSRRVLHAIFSYPFDQLGVQMVLMRTAVSNSQSNGRGISRIARAYGFQQIHIPRL